MLEDKENRCASFPRSRDGTAAVEFAYILPILAILSLGLIELSLIFFDYHRAGEAMRAAVRAVELSPAATSYDTLPMTCPGGANCDQAQINNVLADIHVTLPQLTAANLRISYNESGLGIDDAGGVVTPVVTVSIVNLQHNYFLLSKIIPGVPDGFTFPAFTSSRVVQSIATP